MNADARSSGRKVLLAFVGLFLAAALVLAQRSNPQQQPSSSPGFRVIDRNGTLVGYAVTDKLVAREINGIWVTFYIHPAVGIFDSEAIYLHYLTTDCTGSAYVTNYSTFADGTRVGPRLYYPTDSQTLNPASVRVAFGDGTLGACSATSNIEGVYGVATHAEVASFGLVLPFRAVR